MMLSIVLPEITVYTVLCTPSIHQHLDATVSIRYGPHVVGRFPADAPPAKPESRGKDRPVETVENQKQVFPRSHRPLEIPRRDSHFPTAPTIPLSLSKTKTRKPLSASRRGVKGAVANRTDHV
jgi:hypothetical protein